MSMWWIFDIQLKISGFSFNDDDDDDDEDNNNNK